VPKAVWVSVLILCAVHLALYFAGANIEAWANFLLAFIPARLDPSQGVGQYWFAKYTSFFTYGLLHANLPHLVSNCIWLLIFGTPVARRLTISRFFIVAAAGSFGGALATQLQYFYDHTNVILVGASASVSALMAAATPIMFGQGSVFSRTSTDEAAKRVPVLSFRDLLKSQQAVAFMATFLGLQLFTGAAQVVEVVALLDQRNIAWQAHLGGFVAGLLAFYALESSKVHATGNS
jgi:membrane associated rhomboid family serine protease